MFRIGTENPWSCSYGFDMNADFCLWVLAMDGLQVSPFEHHPAGNGVLQASGLNAENWLVWTHKVISTNGRQQHNARQQHVQLTNRLWATMQAEGGLPGSPGSEEHTQALHKFNQQVLAERRAQPHIFTPRSINPVEMWDGDTAIGQKLAEMWKEYGPISHMRSTWEGKLQAERNHKPSQNLWHDLEPYHESLESLIIHFVEYPQQIEYPIAPLSVIITIVDGQLDYEALRDRALRAAEELATQK